MDIKAGESLLFQGVDQDGVGIGGILLVLAFLRSNVILSYNIIFRGKRSTAKMGPGLINLAVAKAGIMS